VTLHGTRLQSQLGEQFMPAFGKAYSDPEIAVIANYVTGRFGTRAATITPVQVARHREQE